MICLEINRFNVRIATNKKCPRLDFALLGLKLMGLPRLVFLILSRRGRPVSNRPSSCFNSTPLQNPPLYQPRLQPGVILAYFSLTLPGVHRKPLVRQVNEAMRIVITNAIYNVQTWENWLQELNTALFIG